MNAHTLHHFPFYSNYFVLFHQVSQLRTEASTLSAAVEKERAGREKLTAEVDSLNTRLVAATHELDKVSRARTELER